MPVMIKAGKITGITLAGLFVAGLVTGLLYEKEIKQLIITELNKSIETKIKVGEFDFSVMRHFPYASFDLKNVVVEEVSRSVIKDTLLYSSRVSLLFNIMDVFSKNVSVKKILVYDGCINVRIDSTGQGNYHFWKKQEGNSGGGAIDLQRIALKNVYLKYIDKKDRQDYAMLAKKAELSCKFSTGEFSLKTNSDLFVDQLWIHGKNYVDHMPVTINSGLDVNSTAGSYKFDDSRINIAGVLFNFGGHIDHNASAWMLDLSIKANEADVSSFMSIIPQEYTHFLSCYKTKGKLLFTTVIKGIIENKNVPLITIGFTVKDGSVSSGNTSVEKLNFSGTFDNRKGKSKSIIDIPSLTASLAGHAIQASIRLDDLPDAFLTLKAKTQLDLKEIKPFLHADTLESLSGDLAMNVSYEGKVRQITEIGSGRLNNITASGNIDIKNVNFKLKKNPLEFKNLSGNFALLDNDIQIRNFTGNISSSDFHLDGIFKNFISFLLIPGQPGDMQARVSSNSVDLDELLVNKTLSNTKDTSYILKFNPRLYCELEVSINKLNFRRFSASDIHGRVNLDKQVIGSRGLQFNAMGGNITMDATINASRRDSVKMDYDTRFSNVDVTRLFYEMENFDQHTMTDKNVKGRLSADVQFSSVWSNDLTLNSRSVRSTANITIENGELIGFTPIQALAKYIHVPDLNYIRFSTLKNNISISDRKIFIPNMDINSSAINISGNGIHDFDNNIDYHLKLLLSDVLGRKAKSNNTEFGEIEDDGLGHSKLFLSMKGTVDQPHFSYDRKAAGEKIRKDIVQEKQNLKGLLKQQFGLYKNEPSVQVPKPKKREELQIDWSNE